MQRISVQQRLLGSGVWIVNIAVFVMAIGVGGAPGVEASASADGAGLRGVGVIFADGFESGDATGWTQAVEFGCDPVADFGCGPEDKCTFVILSQDPLEGELQCVPDGEVPLGGACSRDEVSGVDDCVGGAFCLGGECEEVCTTDPQDSCGDGAACQIYAGLFDQSTGICEPTCDVFAQDCTEGEGCYLLLGTAGYPTTCEVAVPESICQEPPLSVPQGHGDCCSFVNTCEPGTGCTQLAFPGAASLVCARFCDPTGTVGADTCAADLGADHFCVSMNDFYSGLGDLEDSYGFCVDEPTWGPPSCWNGTQDAGEDGVDCCVSVGSPGCPCTVACP